MKCRRNSCCEFYNPEKKMCQNNKLAYIFCGIWGVIDLELKTYINHK